MCIFFINLSLVFLSVNAQSDHIQLQNRSPAALCGKSLDLFQTFDQKSKYFYNFENYSIIYENSDSFTDFVLDMKKTYDVC